MGIPNFTTFLNSAKFPTDKIDSFDSILMDAQSLLYVAIDNSLKETENALLADICHIVSEEIINILKLLFNIKAHEENVTIVISFDGEGVPMKWPTQQKRREKLAEGRDLYKVVLFGNNSISKNVIRHLQNSLLKVTTRLNNVPAQMRIIISGCDIEGEGEHKLFHIAEHYKCKKPMIVSEDNDVFIISCVHYSKFDNIQIKRKHNTFYRLNDIITNYLQYSTPVLIYGSFLFGNDFIPPIVSITETNPNLIHDALYHCESEYLPDIFYSVLSTLVLKKKIRFTNIMCKDKDLIVDFWKTCLWVLDYYQYKTFPQKYMLNTLYNTFDRNMIITALLNIGYAKQSFEEAKFNYANCVTRPFGKKAIQNVFHSSQLPHIQRFFTNIETDQPGYIFEINIRNRTQM